MNDYEQFEVWSYLNKKVAVTVRCYHLLIEPSACKKKAATALPNLQLIFKLSCTI